MRAIDSGRGCTCVGAGTVLKPVSQFCCGPKTAPKNKVYLKKKKKERHMLLKYSLQTRGRGIHGKRKIKESVTPYTRLIKDQGIKDILLKTLFELMRIHQIS